MMEKRSLIVAVAGVMIAAISVVTFININNMRNFKDPIVNHYFDSDDEESGEFELESNIYDVDYVDNLSNKNMVAGSRSDLESFMKNFYSSSKILDKYSNDYFEDKSLVLIYETTSNSAITFKVNSLEVVDDTLKIDYSRVSSSEVGATVMGGSLIVVEVPKSVTKIELK